MERQSKLYSARGKAHISRMIAITRPVSDSLAECELTHQARVPIDVARARAEHAAYESALKSLGCEILRLPALPDRPDAVFVEDTAVVVDECAVVTRPGAAARREETASMRALLRELLPVSEMAAPGTLDGGDVLRVGKRLFVGISSRTNEAGARQLAALLAPFGYAVTSVRVGNCLHLKSAVTALGDNLVIVNAGAVDPEVFGVPYVRVPDAEAAAANVLAMGANVLCPASAQETAKLLESRGFTVIPVVNTELAKAEAGLTCCSVLVAGA